MIAKCLSMFCVKQKPYDKIEGQNRLFPAIIGTFNCVPWETALASILAALTGFVLFNSSLY